MSIKYKFNVNTQPVIEALVSAAHTFTDDSYVQAKLVANAGGYVEFPLLPLVVASPLLAASAAGAYDAADCITIHLDEFSVETVQLFIVYITKGEVYGTEETIDQLHELCSVLQIPNSMVVPSPVETQPIQVKTSECKSQIVPIGSIMSGNWPTEAATIVLSEVPVVCDQQQILRTRLMESPERHNQSFPRNPIDDDRQSIDLPTQPTLQEFQSPSPRRRKQILQNRSIENNAWQSSDIQIDPLLPEPDDIQQGKEINTTQNQQRHNNDMPVLEPSVPIVPHYLDVEMAEPDTTVQLNHDEEIPTVQKNSDKGQDQCANIRPNRNDMTTQILQCPDCPETFQTEIVFRRHRFVKHKGEKPLGCSKCPARFIRRDVLKRHMMMSHPKMPFRLTVQEEVRLDNKPAEQIDPVEQDVKPDVQPQAPARRPGRPPGRPPGKPGRPIGKPVGLPGKPGRPPGKPGRPARKPGRPPGTPEAPERPARKPGRPRGKPGRPARQSSTPPGKPGINRAKGGKPYACSLCPSAFSRGDTLKLHMTIHSGTAFTCHICDHPFTRPKYLDCHIQQHLRTLKCTKCDLTFANLADFQKHLNLYAKKKIAK